MTVAELIEKLKELPQDLEVQIFEADGTVYPAGVVKICQPSGDTYPYNVECVLIHS